jgi:hypothetical protein
LVWNEGWGCRWARKITKQISEALKPWHTEPSRLLLRYRLNEQVICHSS